MLGWEGASRTASEPTYMLAGWLFLRLLGLIYFVAFVSLATQIKGLVGSKGILPATDFSDLTKPVGHQAFLSHPDFVLVQLE